MRHLLLAMLVLGAMCEWRLHRENTFNSHFVEENDDETISHIIPLDGDPVETYRSVLKSIANLGMKTEELTSCSKGDKDYLKVLAKLVGRLGTKDDAPKITLVHNEDDCFASVDAEYSVAAEYSQYL